MSPAGGDDADAHARTPVQVEVVHLRDAHLVVPPDAADQRPHGERFSFRSARRPAAGPAPATRSTCAHLRRPRPGKAASRTAGCPLRSARVSAPSWWCSDRVPGPDPDAQPQRLPAALGRRGHPVRPGRGHPAPDDLAGVPAGDHRASASRTSTATTAWGCPACIQRHVPGQRRPAGAAASTPRAGEYFDRLRRASSYDDRLEVVPFRSRKTGLS